MSYHRGLSHSYSVIVHFPSETTTHITIYRTIEAINKGITWGEHVRSIVAKLFSGGWVCEWVFLFIWNILLYFISIVFHCSSKHKSMLNLKWVFWLRHFESKFHRKIFTMREIYKWMKINKSMETSSNPKYELFCSENEKAQLIWFERFGILSLSMPSWSKYVEYFNVG